MKPAFALNLTPDGISLLHRTSRGWLLVGAVALDDPDMPAALGYLRKTALGLAPRGFATKLILPASQILYTVVDAPGPDAANRRRQIARALEGRTPYAADDLVFDWSGTGARVNVAVVARETLEEAEAFAQEHRFNPVSFVAMPEDGSFAGEPFFGQTAKARNYIPDGERLVRDQDPVRIAGDADLTRLVAAGGTEGVVGEPALGAAAALAEVGAAAEAGADAMGGGEVVAGEAVVGEAAGGEAVIDDAGAAADVGETALPDVTEFETHDAAEEIPGAEDARPVAEVPEAPAEDAPVETVAEAVPEAVDETGADEAVAAWRSKPADAAPADAVPADPVPEAEPLDAATPSEVLPEAMAPEALAPETPAPELVVSPEAPADSGAFEDAAETPAADSDPRAERRRARAERREREAAARAEAEAEAAFARQPSFGFAAVAEVPTPGADSAPVAEDTFAGMAEAAGDVPDAPAGDAAAVITDDALPLAPDNDADVEEAPFLAVEDEPEEPAAAPRPPELDADGLPTPFAAAATLSAEMPGPRLGAAAPDMGRSGPAKPVAGAGSVISPRLGIAAEPRAEARGEPASRAKSRASGLGKAVIAAGKMAKAAKSARTAGKRVEAPAGASQPRAASRSEAEALTVFGARRATPVRAKPRYLGLMLTVGLVVLMLAIALWSSLPDDEQTADLPAAGTDAAAIRTTAVEGLVDTAQVEDVPTVDALEADAMTEAEIAADGGFEAMGEEGEDFAEVPADLPVDQPEVDQQGDTPEDLAGAEALPDEGLADEGLADEALAANSPAAPDAAAAAAIAAAGVVAGAGLANDLAAADLATEAPAVPEEAAAGPQPDAAEGLPPRPADPAVTERSAEALPEAEALAADTLPAPPQPPLPFGTGFEFDADGLVVATPDGALTPEGVTVVAGTPARVPPARPAAAVEAATAAEAAAEAETAPAEAAAEPASASTPDPALVGKKPLPRPASLVVPAALTPEAAPAASPDDGAALSPPPADAAPLIADPALAPFKPRAASTVAVAAASAARSAEEARAAEMAALQAELASATASAVTSSRKPASRPQDFSRGIEAALAMAATTPAPVVAAAPPPQQAAPAPAPAAAPTRQAAVAPAPEPEELDEPEPVAAAPSIPTSASVAKQATISGAISLRDINLIGVYGASSNRRALVRLANGRMLRVKIGDRIDGGQVTAIGEGQLTYQKGGRTHVLRMIQQS